MALRLVAGFDHYPKNLNTWATYGTPPFTSWASTTAKWTVVDVDNWLKTNAINATVVDVIAFLTMTAILKPTSKKYWVGCRVKFLTAQATTARYFSLDELVNPTANPSRAWVNIFSGADFANRTLGAEYYCEMMVDPDTFLISRWIDGVQLTDITIPAGALRTQVTNRTTNFWLMTADEANQGAAFRDLYVCDDLVDGDNTVVGRQGPMVTSALTLASADSTTWTTTDANLVTGLSNAGTGVVSGATFGDLNLGWSSSLPASYEVAALSYTYTGQKVSGTETKIKSKTTQGANSSVETSLTVTTTIAYNLQDNPKPTKPGGGKWTASDIAAARLVLTPAA